MPNWCDNVVMIKGDKGIIDNVKKTLEENGNVFSFNKVLPCPPALLNTTAPNRSEQSVAYNKSKFGAADWYDWCVSNWGTKWNSSEAIITTEIVDGEESQIAYSFQTAWAPPTPLYDKLASMFPNTNIFINYDECGGDFSGWGYYENGELSKNEEYSDSFYSRRRMMEPDTDIWEMLE